jgi:glycosyltransferase involved in cell wall biosynthesis
MKEELQIGYVPYSQDLDHPDDRRRFPYFASQNNIKFEIAKTNKEFDIVVLPASANLTKWLRYKSEHPKTKFIFEMVDSLIYQSDILNTMFKGVGRFLLGKESLPTLHHKEVLIKWLKTADLVLCSNPVMKKEVEKWNSNVMVCLDYLEHEYKFLKTDYSINGKMKIFWEGHPEILRDFINFKDVFSEINEFCELHIVTSETYSLAGRFFPKQVKSFLEKLPIETHFHKWDLKMNSTIFNNCDCAIIPLNKNDKYHWHKPANKLISFWFSGLPTLTSNTPAYAEVASQSEKDILCETTEDWVTKIRKLYEKSIEQRQQLAIENLNFAKTFYSKRVYDGIWNLAFEKVEKTPQRSEEVLIPSFSIRHRNVAIQGEPVWR